MTCLPGPADLRRSVCAAGLGRLACFMVGSGACRSVGVDGVFRCGRGWLGRFPAGAVGRTDRIGEKSNLMKL